MERAKALPGGANAAADVAGIGECKLRRLAPPGIARGDQERAREAARAARARGPTGRRRRSDEARHSGRVRQPGRRRKRAERSRGAARPVADAVGGRALADAAGRRQHHRSGRHCYGNRRRRRRARPRRRWRQPTPRKIAQRACRAAGCGGRRATVPAGRGCGSRHQEGSRKGRGRGPCGQKRGQRCGESVTDRKKRARRAVGSHARARPPRGRRRARRRCKRANNRRGKGARDHGRCEWPRGRGRRLLQADEAPAASTALARGRTEFYDARGRAPATGDAAAAGEAALTAATV